LAWNEQEHFERGLSIVRPQRAVLARRHYAWLSLGLAIFVVYGSLVPFHFRNLAWEQAVELFREVCRQPVRVSSRSDWLANFALVMPLGYLFMGALCVDQRRRAGLAALAVLVACASLSVAVEFAQLWFPPRVPSVNDIVAQSLGAVLGVGIWLVAGQRLTDGFRAVWPEIGRSGARLLPGYLFLLVLINGMPFDLTLSPAAIYRKYQRGQVRLMPFAGYGEDVYQALSKDVWNVALFLPLGMLLEQFPGLNRRGGRGWPRVLGLALMVTLLLQGMKLFVLSRWVDATPIVTGSLAILAGWRLALLLRERRVAAGLSGRASDRGGIRARGRRLALLSLWLAAAVFLSWQPFDFNLDAGGGERLSRESLVPFLDYYQGNYWNSFDQLVHKTLLFVPLGALLGFVLHGVPPRRTGVMVVLAAALVATTLEAGQLFLPTRYASVTDIIVESSGAWLGWLLASCYLAASAPP
jgi:glycopeptide antibiotics resistance protein